MLRDGPTGDHRPAHGADDLLMSVHGRATQLLAGRRGRGRAPGRLVRLGGGGGSGDGGGSGVRGAEHQPAGRVRLLHTTGELQGIPGSPSDVTGELLGIPGGVSDVTGELLGIPGVTSLVSYWI